MKTLHYNGQSGSTLRLQESEDLLIVRTSALFDPEELLNAELQKIEMGILSLIDYYPEASVYIFQVQSNKPSRHRRQLKKRVRALRHHRIVFVGSVFQNQYGVYQIYTGNLFLKFTDETPVGRQGEIVIAEKMNIKKTLSFAHGTYFIKHKTKLGRDIFQFCQDLLQRPEVELCQPELVVKRKSITYTKAKGHHQGDHSWATAMIQLSKAWKYTKGEGVKIAIIDDGIDLDHPAFKGAQKLLNSIDFFGEAGTDASHKFSSEMHGTACASIACSNDPSALGIAPAAQLLVARTKGLGSVLEAEAIRWAVEEGADIISCSWGPADGIIDNPKDDNWEHPLPDYTRLAIEYAATKGREGKGCLIFFAAGNGKEWVKNDGYASNPNVMAIGSVNKQGKLTQYSDRGYPLFCCFPSSEITIEQGRIIHQYGLLTADRLGAEGYSESDYFATFGGTSASCPGMAGIAALLLSLCPQLSVSQARQLLLKSCTYPPDQVPIPGRGIINAFQVVKNTLNFKKTKSTIMAPFPKQTNRALHIALNFVDANIYGAPLSLSGCINDAEFYASLCTGFSQNKILVNEEATRNQVIKEIRKLAQESERGDYVFITYAGHGSRVNDDSGDEQNEDYKDETLLLFDGLLIDDKLNNLFAEFDAGVNIVWVSDSCHSGTNSRNFLLPPVSRPVRLVPDHIAQKVYEQGKVVYDLERQQSPLERQRSINDTTVPSKANIISIASCQPDEYAGDAPENGLFTGTIKQLLAENPSLSYRALIDLAKEQDDLQGYQEPNIEGRGKQSQDLLSEAFFQPKNIGNTSSSNGLLPPTAKPAEEQQSLLDNKELIIATVPEKGQKKANPIPLTSIKIKSKGRRNQSQSNKLVLTQGSVSAEGLERDAPWDRAYKLLSQVEHAASIDYIEPDLTSAINGNPDTHAPRSGGYIAAYPPSDDSPQSLVWHLDAQHSQLRKAFLEATRDVEIQGGLNSSNRNNFPLIVHIDTGVLPHHPTTPENFQHQLSEDFADPYDRKKLFGGLIGEQQGHGHGTITILAGAKLSMAESDYSYNNYLGAFPYARVVTLRISESVYLLGGRQFAKALRYAIKIKADVVSMSMAGTPSLAMQEAVNEAYEQGIVVVSAAGNSWKEGVKKKFPDTLMYPARFKRVLGVTGATFDDTPYLFEPVENRAEDGSGMGTCYGPSHLMDTVMAAYTPNVVWASKSRSEGLFVKTGGGTSSATPQVAAAAALWLYKNRDQMKALRQSEPWKVVEAVRKALFDSAKKTYKTVFGQGILRAQDALQITPDQQFLNRLRKRDWDDISQRTWLGSILDMYHPRSAQANKSKYQKMLSMEIEQLIMTEPGLEEFRNDDYEESALKIKLFTCEGASKQLKRLLSLDKDVQIWRKENRSLRSSSFQPQSQHIPLPSQEVAAGERIIITSSSTAFTAEFKDTREGKDDHFVGQLKIDIQYQHSRSKEKADIDLILPENENLSYLICHEYEDGEKYYSWQYPGIDQSTDQRVANWEQGEWELKLQTSRKRGWFKKLKNAVVSIFRVLTDKSPAKFQGLVYYDTKKAKDGWQKMSKQVAQKINKQAKTIYFSHGTFSSTKFNFRKLMGTPSFLKEVHRLGYGNLLVGFNMSTVRSGIQENIEEIKKELSDFNLNTKNYSIIAHSRGCLVARGVFGTKNNKMILCAGPHLGTPIADVNRVIRLIDTLTNLAIDIAGFRNPLFKVFPNVLKMVARGILRFPGITDMKADSEIINLLNSDHPLTPKQLLLATNFTILEGIKFTIDYNNDRQIFDDEMNDLVIPYDSAHSEGLGNPKRSVAFRNSKLHHLDHFGDQGVRDFILKGLEED